jgi:hypothetical protein
MLHGFEGELMQTATAVRHILDDLLAHARLPEFLEMVGHARKRLLARITGEKQGDLVSHVNHVSFFHLQSPGMASFCLEIFVVISRVWR